MSTLPTIFNLTRRWGGLLCRFGFHRAAPYREYRDRWGDTAIGGDCVRCGQGPL